MLYCQECLRGKRRRKRQEADNANESSIEKEAEEENKYGHLGHHLSCILSFYPVFLTLLFHAEHLDDDVAVTTAALMIMMMHPLLVYFMSRKFL